MATLLDVNSLTLNPKEETDFERFVFERIYEQPLLNAIHRVCCELLSNCIFEELITAVGLQYNTVSKL